MADLDLEFKWKVCDRGYEIVTVEASEPKKAKPRLRRLMPPPALITTGGGEPAPGVYIRPKGKKFRAKHLLQHYPGLYLEFAALDGSAETCVDFANKAGLLRCETDPEGEFFPHWQGHIKKMHRKIGLWQTDSTALAVDERGEIKVGDLVAVLRPMPPDEHLALRIRPRHLLGAMELQIAASVTAGRELRSCKHCAQLFEVGPGAKRYHAEFCSTKHQTDYNNARKLRG